MIIITEGINNKKLVEKDPSVYTELQYEDYADVNEFLKTVLLLSDAGLNVLIEAKKDILDLLKDGNHQYLAVVTDYNSELSNSNYTIGIKTDEISDVEACVDESIETIEKAEEFITLVKYNSQYEFYFGRNLHSNNQYQFKSFQSKDFIQLYREKATNIFFLDINLN